MSLRSPLLACALLTLLVAPLGADRLLVAGPDGLVMQADTNVGDFEYFACQCAGPIRALAADDQRLYAADEFGQLLVFDVQTGAMQALFSTGHQINALAAGLGSIFLGTEDGLVVRLDPATGLELSSRVAPAGVRALLAHGGDLFVGTADSAVYRAPLEAGALQYFGCFCFTNIQDMVVVGRTLAVVDEFGLVARLDLGTGNVLSAFSAGQTNSMAVLGRDLLFYYQGGAITRFDAKTGLPHGNGFTSPVGVEVMLLIPDEPQIGSSKGIPNPPQGTRP